MANKAKSSVPPVMSMADVSKLTRADTVNLFVEKTTTVSRAYMDSAKLIIHLKSTLSKTETIHGILGKKGVRTSTINNAMQAVRVWESLVERDLVSEIQFDKLSYSAFAEINAALKLKGMHVVGPLVAAGDLDEVEFIAEHKMTSAEKKAEAAKSATATTPAPKKREEKPAAPEPAKSPEPKPDTAPDKTREGEKITHLTEPERKDTTTLQAQPPAPDVTNIIAMPKRAVTLAEGEALVDSLQNCFAELSEDEFIVLSGKLVALTDMVVEQESVIRSKKAA